MAKELENLFSDEPNNALYTAFLEASTEYMDSTGKFDKPLTREDGSEVIYDYLRESPITSLVSELTQHLGRLGFQIVRKP